jgi:ketosteroid isomerase-like protein
MTRALIVVLLSSLIPQVSAAQNTNAPEQELRDLDTKFVAAVVKNDRAFLAQIYADDYYCIHSNGVAMTRAEELASRATVAWTDSRTDDIKVRIYGDVGIVTGRLALAGSATGFAPGARRFTDIYLRRNGQWRIVGCQSTLVPEKK